MKDHCVNARMYSVGQAQKGWPICKHFVNYKILVTCEGQPPSQAAMYPQIYSLLHHQNNPFSCLLGSVSWIPGPLQALRCLISNQ